MEEPLQMSARFAIVLVVIMRSAFTALRKQMLVLVTIDAASSSLATEPTLVLFVTSSILRKARA